jgi:hypothetical protein
MRPLTVVEERRTASAAHSDIVIAGAVSTRHVWTGTLEPVA